MGINISTSIRMRIIVRIRIRIRARIRLRYVGSIRIRIFRTISINCTGVSMNKQYMHYRCSRSHCVLVSVCILLVPLRLR